MTQLQQLAFIRIRELSDEAAALLPKELPMHGPIPITKETIFGVHNKLSELNDWHEALRREEHS